MNRIARRATAVGVLVTACFNGGTASANDASQQPQRIHLVSISRDGADRPTRAVATGPILGHGTATHVVDGATEEGLVGRFDLQLDGGTVSGTFVQRTFELNFDPQACMARPTAAGTMDITGGTGEYAGASGTLEYTRSGVIVAARGEGGECLGRSAPPKVVAMRVEAVGTASISG